MCVGLRICVCMCVWPPSVFVVFTPVPMPPTNISHNKLHTNSLGNLRLLSLCSVCVDRVKVNKGGGKQRREKGESTSSQFTGQEKVSCTEP